MESFRPLTCAFHFDLLYYGRLALFGGFLFSAEISFAATVSWTGAGETGLWSDPKNWSGGALPTSEDDVVINVPGKTTVRMDAPQTVVRSLQCEESLLLEADLFTVTDGASVINGAFNMASSRELVAQGPTTTFTVNGPVTNVAGLQALAGASISFPNAHEIAIASSFSYPRWYTYGDSVIAFANLTNVIITPGYSLQLSAFFGSRIDLRQLSVPEGPINAYAQYEDSVIDLSGMSGLWTQGSDHGRRGGLSASEGGSVLIPNVTAVERVDFYLGSDAVVNIAQLESYTDGSLTLISRTNGFTSLTNFSGLLLATDVRLDWTNLTRLHATNSNLFIWANQGSVIDFSQLTNVLIDAFFRLDISASTGSQIDLRRLRQPEGILYAQSLHASSRVDLSGLTGAWEGRDSSLAAEDGGAILVSNVTALNNVSLDIRDDAILATDQIRSFTGGSIILYRRTNGFAGLTNFHGNLYANASRLDWTNFTVFHATNTSLYFSADEGSLIDLSRLTNVISDASFGISAVAYRGSQIDLQRLRSSVTQLFISTQGEGSRIDLSGLSGLWRGYNSISASEGGSVLIPNVTALDNINLYVSGDAMVNLAQLTSLEGGFVTLSSRTNDFPAVTNLNGSSFQLHDSRLDLTNFTVLYATNRHLRFRAEQGSVIDLSNITNLVSDLGYGLAVESLSGSRVDLRRLQLLGGPLFADARNAGSIVDLSGVVGLWNGPGILSAWDAGTISISNVTAMRDITLFLSDTADVRTEQLGSFNDGQIHLFSRTNVFGALTNFTGVFGCGSSARAEFPNLTELSATNGSIAFSSDSASVLALSQVTNLIVDSGQTLSLSAFNAGRIELPRLETMVAGHVFVQADGAEAVVDLSGLTGFFSDNNGGSLIARNGGTILLNNAAMLLAGVAIDIQSNAGSLLPPFLAPSQSLVLYGQPSKSYRIESHDPLEAGSPWSLYRRVPLTEPLQIVGVRPPKDLVLRVHAFVADPPEVDIRSLPEGKLHLVLFGVPERSYQIETKTDLQATVAWQDGPTTAMTNSFFIYPETAATNNARLFRARQL
jgi:hypothetical protein